MSFSDLESLVDYIYKGSTHVPGKLQFISISECSNILAGSSVQSFLNLAQSLGVSGFSDDSYKENILMTNSTPTTPLSKKSSSVPAGIDEAGSHHHHQGSASKKRKLFTQSLDETVSDSYSNNQPLYSNIQSQPIYSNLQPNTNVRVFLFYTIYI